jgi:hypothetical protein
VAVSIFSAAACDYANAAGADVHANHDAYGEHRATSSAVDDDVPDSGDGDTFDDVHWPVQTRRPS